MDHIKRMTDVKTEGEAAYYLTVLIKQGKALGIEDGLI